MVDDSAVVRAALRAVLGTDVVGEARGGVEAVAAARRLHPEVVLLDVRMPGGGGLAALPELVASGAAVLMLTYSGEGDVVREAVRMGAAGYLVHGEFDTAGLTAAVRDAASGRAHLTPTAATAVLAGVRAAAEGAAEGAAQGTAGGVPLQPQRNLHLQSDVGDARARFGLSQREGQIMELVADGLSNPQIAAACFVSEKTVKNHINRIFAKLGATRRGQAIAVWLGRRRAGACP